MITPKWIIFIMILCLPVIASAEDTKQSAQETDLPEGVEFVEYDTPPQPVGGFEEITKNLTYPEEARKNGLEGRVIIYAKIDLEGNVVDIKIAQSLSPECDKAAVEALKVVEWKPAKKGNKPIATWVAIPIEFKLH